MSTAIKARSATRVDEGPLLSSDATKMDLIRALNWASQEREVKDLQPFVVRYMAISGRSADDQKAVATHDVTLTPTDFAMCRLAVLGDLPPTVRSDLDRRIDAAVIAARELADAAAKKAAHPSRLIPRSTSVVHDLIGALDYQIDLILANKTLEIRSPYAFLQELDLSSAQLAALSAWIQRAIAQHDSLEDPAVAVGYSLAFKRRYKAIAKWLRIVETDIDTLRDNAKRTRKKRQIKPSTIVRRREKAINTTLATLVYQTECEQSRVRSLNPQKVFGASVVVTYNTQTRAVNLLVAKEGETLSIKKQSIVGVDPDQSISKKVRAPARTIPQIAAAPRMEAQRIVRSVIKTTGRKASNRLNDSTIIVAAHTVAAPNTTKKG